MRIKCTLTFSALSCAALALLLVVRQPRVEMSCAPTDLPLDYWKHFNRYETPSANRAMGILDAIREGFPWRTGNIKVLATKTRDTDNQSKIVGVLVLAQVTSGAASTWRIESLYRTTDTWLTTAWDHHLNSAALDGPPSPDRIAKFVADSEWRDLRGFCDARLKSSLHRLIESQHGPPPPCRPSEGHCPTLKEAGERLFRKSGCAHCHNSKMDRMHGGSLIGVFGSEISLTDGSTARADAEFIRESILNPSTKLRLGARPVMPGYAGQFNNSELQELSHYIQWME